MDLHVAWNGHAMLILGLLLILLCKAMIFCALGAAQCIEALQEQCRREEDIEEPYYVTVLGLPPVEDEDPYPIPEDPFPEEESTYEEMLPSQQ